MNSIGDILNQKGGTVHSVTPSDTVLDAIRRMAELGVGALVVMDGDELTGMISERDYSRKVILQGLQSRNTPVSAIMSTPVMTISPDASVKEGLSMMTEKFVRHLPVTDNTGGIIGMVSIGDLVKAVIEDQQNLIEQLERYITR